MPIRRTVKPVPPSKVARDDSPRDLVFNPTPGLGCLTKVLACVGLLLLGGGLLAMVTRRTSEAIAYANLGAILVVGFLIHDQLVKVRQAIERRRDD